MVRPREFADLTATSVSIGRQQLEAAKAAGINLSELLRVSIDRKLRTPAVRAPHSKTMRKLKGIPKAAVNKVTKVLSRNPEVAPRQAEKFNEVWGTSLEADDLLSLVPRF